ncbi:ferredoxin [Micromonospora sp. PLK6-60]|uniref:ferredoxin n=1 Tax=Micromonospora sp. PLK6-60 TaxID=2873383 RepID=UPI0035AC17B1
MDRDRCCGAGNCVLTAPEVFDQDDTDGLVLLRRAVPPADAVDRVRGAVELCPAGAISLDPSADPPAAGAAHSSSAASGRASTVASGRSSTAGSPAPETSATS